MQLPTSQSCCRRSYDLDAVRTSQAVHAMVSNATGPSLHITLSTLTKSTYMVCTHPLHCDRNTVHGMHEINRFRPFLQAALTPHLAWRSGQQCSPGRACMCLHHINVLDTLLQARDTTPIGSIPGADRAVPPVHIQTKLHTNDKRTQHISEPTNIAELKEECWSGYDWDEHACVMMISR